MKSSDYFKQEIPAMRRAETQRVLNEIDDTLLSLEHYFLSVIKKCKSPIEKLFAIRLIWMWEHKELFFREIDNRTQLDLAIQPQVEVRGKTYRIDFGAYVTIGDSHYDFAIECDGHDFHEKTKAQAVKDKARDRDLQSVGYRTIRFTGSEIWESPSKCVRETFDIIYKTTGLEEKHRSQLGLD